MTQPGRDMEVPFGAMRSRRSGWVATFLLLVACTTPRPGGRAEPNGPSPATDPAVQVGAEQGRWRRITEAPIPPAGGMAAAWTGSRLIVWGGQAADGFEPAGAGAAYDPATDRWELLPPAPIAARFGTTAVWTGQEVLFWAGQGGPTTTFADGAAYDPAARRWRVLAAAPIGARTGHQAVWTGREMVVWGGFPLCCPVDSVIHDPAAAAYDPAADRWRPVAPVPPPWSGDDGSAVTVADAGRPLVWRDGRLAAYDAAADRWAEIPGAPAPVPPAPAETVIRSTADPFALGVVAGDEVFVWTGPAGGGLDGAAYRPAHSAPTPGAWRRTATLDAQSGAAIAAGGPGRIYAAAGQSARILEYRIDEDRWAELPDPPIRTRSGAVLAWTGTELLVWGGAGDEGPEADGAIWHCC